MQVQNSSHTNDISSPNLATAQASAVAPPQGKTILEPPSTLKQTLVTTAKAAMPAQTSSISAPAAASVTQTTAAASSDALHEKNVRVKLDKAKGVKSKKQIPTLLGLLILFVALISGVLLFGQGTGVFAPRATAQSTPKNIRISNVTDKTFTVSFYTDESTIAAIKYGTDAKSLTSQASDDRDQLSGVVKDYRLHYITVRSLSPSTEYFYELVSNDSSFDNNDQPYAITTATKPSQSPTNTQTVYGSVFNADAAAAEGAIVYLYSEGVGTLSSLVKASGSWGISLSNAFKTDKTAYAILDDTSAIEIKVQGIEPDLVSSAALTVATAQPVPNITLGAGSIDTSSAQASDAATLASVDKAELLAAVEPSASAQVATKSSDATKSSSLVNPTEEASTAGNLQNLLVETAAEDTEILDLDSLETDQAASTITVTTSQPQIKATLPANTVVRVVIHSDTAIDEMLQTDADGNLTLDVASLGQNLEPGEHSATYTYVDPTTGEEITKTYNFTVAADTSTRQLAAVITSTPTPTVTTSVPYGSGNPYKPITATPTATVSAVSTRSAIVSTSSGQYNSGSVGTTLALLAGGLFFVLAGVWSYSLVRSVEQETNKK